jgi:hypothetical protein
MDPTFALAARIELTTLVAKSDQLLADFDKLVVDKSDPHWSKIMQDKFRADLSSLRDHAFNGLAAALEKSHTIP